jgi:hypothetical protein
MKTLSWMILLAAVCYAGPLCAESLKGKPAPDFKAGTSVTTPYEHTTLAECKAEVVLIKLWGVN